MMGEETVIAEPAWLRQGSWVVCPVLGGVLGWLLKSAVGWLLSLPWVPFEGPLKLVDAIPEPAGTLGAMGLGVVAGLLFALVWDKERLVVTVSPERVLLERDKERLGLDRDKVSAVFLEAKTLVLLGAAGSELASETSDLPPAELERAFRGHGYPWADTDPYAEDYRLWVEDTPGLPDEANALLKARQKALAKGESEDVRELRVELVKLGVVVREESKRQYWRVS